MDPSCPNIPPISWSCTPGTQSLYSPPHLILIFHGDQVEADPTCLGPEGAARVQKSPKVWFYFDLLHIWNLFTISLPSFFLHKLDAFLYLNLALCRIYFVFCRLYFVFCRLSLYFIFSNFVCSLSRSCLSSRQVRCSSSTSGPCRSNTGCTLEHNNHKYTNTQIYMTNTEPRL